MGASEAGREALGKLLARDPDLGWAIRENLKKKRLAAHADRVARLKAALGGA